MTHEINQSPLELKVADRGIHEARRKRLRGLLSQHNADAVLLSKHTNVDYFTGFKGLAPEEDRESYLLITRNSTYLFTPEMYFGQAKKHLKEEEVVSIDTLPDKLMEISEAEGLSDIRIEEDDLTVGEFKWLKKVWGENPLEDFPVDDVRLIKDEREIDQLREVSHATDRVFGLVLPRIREGITELELRDELEDCIKDVRYDVGFKAIVAFGTNAGEPHHLTDETRLGRNNFVLFDFGLKGKEGYLSDMSRTVFFGEPTDAQRRQYETVREAQQTVLDRLDEIYSYPGNGDRTMSTKEADAIARDYITDAGYPSFPHALGHGIGLNVHEAPILSPRREIALVRGMVITDEPGIYLPDGGVRIEDVLAIGNNGIEVFNQAPKELIVIPAAT